MSRPRLVALLLALVTLLVFLPTGWFGFVNFDDTDYVTNNAVVKHGLTLAGLRWAFTTFHACNWHPLTWISHMTDCALFGVNAGADHLVNVLFHAANVALLFIWLRRMTEKTWSSAFVAALFAWHPLHVESVAWISERKDVLSTFFALLALLNYTHFVKRKRRRSYWLALVCFICGLLAKPMLVTLPFVMLLLDYWPLGRIHNETLKVADWRPLVLEKVPFLLLAVASCVVTFLAQRHGDAVASLAVVPLSYRLENASVAVVRYLLKLFWPVNLSVFYPMPDAIPALNICLALGVVLAVSFAAWRWRRPRPWFLVGWLWFLGTLVPVIGLVQVGGQAMADRYTYLPSIGFFIALVWLGNEFLERIPTPRIIRPAFAGLISLACILATENQLSFWRDSEALFRRAAVTSPNNDLALLDLGVALDAQGRFAEALEVYHQAERLGSRRYQIYNNLGNVLKVLGRHAESLAEYRKAIQLNPDKSTLHLAAANQLAALGRYDEALGEFAAAQQLNPNDVATHVDAAKVLFKTGRDARGLDEFSAALRLEPDNFVTLATIAHYLAANQNAPFRDGKSAVLLARKADDLSGHTQPMVLDILAMTLAETGDFTNAVTCEQHALQLAAAVHLTNPGPLQIRLELYQNHQPWRESFRATNPPAGK